MNRTDPILIPVFGGLGNQMFQLANAVALSNLTGRASNFVDLTKRVRGSRHWQLGCFGISSTPLSRLKILKMKSLIILFEKIIPRSIHPAFGVFIESELESRQTNYKSYKIVSGYWQSEQYFKEFRQEIVQTLKFPPIQENPYLPEIKSHANSIAVHIRRGDFVNDPIARAHHLVCDQDWYEAAIKNMREAVPDGHFFIFSDDKDWAISNFEATPDCTIVNGSPEEAAWVDMALMSNCKHFIISNSSYSWWAAYLGARPNTRTVAPTYWYPGRRTENLGIYRPDWILL